MAYKFQLGAANMGGNLTQKGDIAAAADQVTGSQLTCDAITTAQSSLANNHILLTDVASKLVSDSAIKIDAGGARMFLENTDEGRVTLSDTNANFANKKYVEIKTNSSAGQLQLQFWDGSNDVTLIDLDGSDGAVSGSGNIVVSGDLTCTGSLVITGDLTLTGNGGGDDAELGDANTDTWTVQDKIVLLADGEANGTGTKIRFGRPGVDNNGGMLYYDDADSTGKQTFSARDGDAAGEIALSASVWHGDGGFLSAVPGTSTPKYAYGTHSSAGNLVVGYQLITATGITMTLPAAPSAGDVIRVHVDAACTAASPLVIQQGHGDQRIDGETSINIESPNTSLELVFLGDSITAFGESSKRLWAII